MDSIAINDAKQQLIFANEDLIGIQSLILTVTDHPEYANAYEILNVIDRALGSIVNDIQEIINSIDAEIMMKKGENVQQG